MRMHRSTGTVIETHTITYEYIPVKSTDSLNTGIYRIWFLILSFDVVLHRKAHKFSTILTWTLLRVILTHNGWPILIFLYKPVQIRFSYAYIPNFLNHVICPWFKPSFFIFSCGYIMWKNRRNLRLSFWK